MHAHTNKIKWIHTQLCNICTKCFPVEGSIVDISLNATINYYSAHAVFVIICCFCFCYSWIYSRNAYGCNNKMQRKETINIYLCVYVCTHKSVRGCVCVCGCIFVSIKRNDISSQYVCYMNRTKPQDLCSVI